MANSLENYTHENKGFLFQNWQKESHDYTADDLISAFEQGQEKALSQQEKVLKKHLQNNIEKATNSAEELAEELSKQFDIVIKGMHLKILNMDEYSLIIGISGDDYFSNIIDEVYSYINNLEKDLKSDQFCIDFKFVFTDQDELNRDGLITDGYILYYNSQEARTS